MERGDKNDGNARGYAHGDRLGYSVADLAVVACCEVRALKSCRVGAFAIMFLFVADAVGAIGTKSAAAWPRLVVRGWPTGL
jgi:hypothetical protein